MIAGGGIGDGEIDGVVNLYVIDDDTRKPIEGATVRVGDVDGTTDADGLFVADGVIGPHTVIVKASGYHSDMWVGANGANMTFDLEKPTPPAAAKGIISGTVDLSGVTIPAGHFKAALVTYLQSDDLGDTANEIETPMEKNICGVVQGAVTQTCNWTVHTRTGSIALLALIVDVDPVDPSNPNDDVTSFVRWGYASATGVAKDATVSGVTLNVLPMTDNATETVDFGTPPANLEQHLGIVGVETADGVFQIPFPTGMAMPSVGVPKLSAVGGTGYRLTAIAQNTGNPPTQSIVIRKGQTASTLNAGAWITPPTNVTLTRTHATFTATAGATVHTIEYTSGETKILNVSLFDGTTAIDIPEMVALPSGSVEGKVQAIGADGLDVNDFELDRDKAKLNSVGSTPAQIAN